MDADAGDVEGMAENKEDGCGCEVGADEVSKSDLRFVGCSALAPGPRLLNNPPPEEAWEEPSIVVL
jgi:hypothetical protein